MTARTQGARTPRAKAQNWLMRLRDFLSARRHRRRPTLRLEELSPHLLRDIGLADGVRLALGRGGRRDA
jgi:uncharacterized protein YjiS (DUF1127 family)